MQFLLDGLHEDLNRVLKKPYTVGVDSNNRPDEIVAVESWETHVKRNDSHILDTCFGQLRSHVTCQNCKEQSVKFDAYSSLSLPIPYKNSKKLKIIIMLPLLYARNNTTPTTASVDIDVLPTVTISELKNILTHHADLCCKYYNVADSGNNSVDSQLIQLYSDIMQYNCTTAVIVDKMEGDLKFTMALYTRFKPNYKSDLLVNDSANAINCLHNKYFEIFASYRPIQFPICVTNDHSSEELEYIRSKIVNDFNTVLPNDVTSIEYISVEYNRVLRLSSCNNVIENMYPEHIRLPRYITLRDLYLYIWIYSEQYIVNKEYIQVTMPETFDTTGSRTHIAFMNSACAVVFDANTRCHYYIPFVIAVCGYNGYSGTAASGQPSPGVMKHEAYNKNEEIIDLSNWLRNDNVVALVYDNAQLILRLGDVKYTHALSDVGIDRCVKGLLIKHTYTTPLPVYIHEDKLSFEVPVVAETSKLTIYDCLNKFSEREVLPDTETYYCSKCNQHLAPIKKLDLYTTPDVLVIQLKRFLYTPGTYFVQREKIHDIIEFPLHGLDLSHHVLFHGIPPTSAACLPLPSLVTSGLGCSGNSTSNTVPLVEQVVTRASKLTVEEHVTHAEIHHPDNMELSMANGCSSNTTGTDSSSSSSSPYIYDLYAVSEHMGGLGGGHYTAKCVNFIDNKWYSFNDSNVSVVPEDRLRDSIVTPEAYVLFYKRRSLYMYDCI